MDRMDKVRGFHVLQLPVDDEDPVHQFRHVRLWPCRGCGECAVPHVRCVEGYSFGRRLDRELCTADHGVRLSLARVYFLEENEDGGVELCF